MSKATLHPKDGHVDHRNKVNVFCAVPGCKNPAAYPDPYCLSCATILAHEEPCPICGREAFDGCLCAACLSYFSEAGHGAA